MRNRIINIYIERYKYLALSVIFFLSGIMIETNIFFRRFDERHVEKFQEIVYKKQTIAENIIAQVQQKIRENYNSLSQQFIFELTNEIGEEISQRGISFIIFKNNEAYFWTDNQFYLEEVFEDNDFSFPTSTIDHNFYLSNISEYKEYKIVLLSLIKKEYIYENDYLNSSFQDDFSVSEHIKILQDSTTNDPKIFSKSGSYLFSLTDTSFRIKNKIQINMAIALYFLGFIFLLFFLHNFLLKFRRKRHVDIFNILFFIIVLITRYWMVTHKVPFIAYTTDLFSPQFFGISDFIPSLGDLIINSFFLLYFIVQLNNKLREGNFFNGSLFLKRITLVITPILITVYFYFATSILETLLLNSNIPLEANKILDLSLLSFGSFVVILLIYYCYAIFINGFLSALPNNVSIYEFQKYSLVPFILSLTVFLKFKNIEIGIIAAVTHLVMFAIFAYIHFKRNQTFSFSVKFLLIILFAIFTQQLIYKYTFIKNFEIKKLYSLNLANEQDPIAELLLTEIETTMRSDSILDSLMLNPVGKDNYIYNYLEKKYFSGFFKKYKLESTICGESSNFNETNTISNCDNYFQSIIDKYGIKLKQSNYFFLNNQNGSISYFSSLSFKSDSGLNKLYLELNSKLINEELGYPVLLLNDNIISNSRYKAFSYAIYKNDKLVSRKGEYPYNLSYPFPVHVTSREYEQHKKDSHNHLVYNIDNNTCIIISDPAPSVFDHLISIAYLSLIFFVTLMFTEFMNSVHKGTWRIHITFRHKIQFVIIGLLITSMILIGIIVIIMNIRQFKDSQYDQLNDKLHSVLAELESHFSHMNSIDDLSSAILTYRLINFSNIYFSDINIYSIDGFLKASSRNEIFNYGLSGKQMNIKAFERMNIKEKPEFIHQESIGELDYLSAYALLKNKDNIPLAIVNLPYFSKQDTFTEQLSSVIITILNIFVILMVISTIVAVFIANLVTKPLDLLKEKLSTLNLAGNNEKIDWHKNDEIGSLIFNYNRMVDKLDSSAKLLAESEREGAWREMAKQIAHEIKNPLTPMKLNIQFLKRAWKNKDDNFEERLQNVSNSIIEQIDALAKTATEFSNFAKMNELNLEKTNVAIPLLNAINLFDETEYITILYDFSIDDEFIILADKEKLLQAFNNIIKNAIQAIPPHREGIIDISIFRRDDYVTISIKDNGCGIADDMKDRLFEPNFTTKSSGSGLGLPITKSIIENLNGCIYFTSDVDFGSTFIIEFPEYF